MRIDQEDNPWRWILVELKSKLQGIIDLGEDSLRFYRLGNNYKDKVVHVGTKEAFDPSDVMII